MFGMEKPKKEEKPAFLFDLEKDLRDENKRRELASRIESRILRIKELLRKGSRKEDYDKLGILLNGYHSMAIVLSRASQEPPRKTSKV